MKINEIKELIQSLDKSSIRYFEMEQSNLKLKISKDSGENNCIDHKLVKENVVNHLIETKKLENNEIIIENDDIDCIIVKSPMVGVYYSSSSPEADAFVNVGNKVEAGQVLCIIEAMKIMNEIVSEVSGEIVEILVENEDLVEYGQPIIKIRRS